MEPTLRHLNPKSFVAGIIICVFLLFLLTFNAFGYDFTTKQKKSVEQDNNVLAAKGYIVENLVYRNKTLGPPVLLACDLAGQIYMMNNKGKIFLSKDARERSLVACGMSCPVSAIDIAIGKNGDIIGLEKNNVFRLTKNGRRVFLARIPDKIIPARIAVNGKSEIYIIDDLMHTVYLLAKGGLCVRKNFDFKVLDISFDEESNMYILDDTRKIHVLNNNSPEVKASFDIPKNRNPDRIAVNTNGSQIYLLDTKSRGLYAITKYGVLRNVAILSSYHAPLSKPIIGNDDTVYLLTGQSANETRIIRIGIDYEPHRNYAVAYQLADYSPDAIGIDKYGNLFFGDGKNIVSVKNGSFDRETVLDDKNGLGDPEGINFDGQGNCYVSDDAARKVFKINRSNKEVSIYADEALGLEEPQSVVFDKAGNAFIGDEKTRKIFKITPSGSVSEFISAKDGLRGLENIAIDSSDFIYVAPENNDQIFKISPQGKLSVFADADQGLIGPGAVAIDSKGYVYIADEETSTVYKFSPGAELQSRIKINSTTLRHLGGIAVSETGKVYVCSRQAGSSLIYIVDFDRPFKRTSKVSQGLYAMHRVCGLKDGLFMPSGLAFDQDSRTLYIGTAQMLFKLKNDKLTPVCRIEQCGFKDLALAKNGDILATSGGSAKVYRIGADLSIQTLATKDDGLRSPEGITLDDQSRVYIADEQAGNIFVIQDNKVKPIKGWKVFPEKIFYHDSCFYLTEEGPARFSMIRIDPKADFNASLISKTRQPYCEGIAMDADQNIYLSADGWSEIYKFKQLTDEKEIVADWWDGLIGPESLVVDDEANLYVADQEAHAVFRISEIKAVSRK